MRILASERQDNRGDNPARIQLLFAEQVAAVHIDHFQRLAAAVRHTGQRIFSNHDRNARLFH